MHPERYVFVGSAQDHLTSRSDIRHGKLRLVFPADQTAVRQALKTSMDFLRNLDLEPDECGPIELVMAEVINNIVEHAYEGHVPGVVELLIRHGEDRISVTVLDDGVPMPNGATPAGNPHDLQGDTDTLPEGGFGWFLIRELTEDIHYSRDGNRNRLTFVLPTTRIVLTH